MLNLVKGLTAIPVGQQFVCPNPKDLKEGEVILEGEFGRAWGDALAGRDVEFLLTDSGVAVWHDEYFRGLGEGRWRIIKLNGKLVFQKAVLKAPAEAKAP